MYILIENRTSRVIFIKVVKLSKILKDESVRRYIVYFLSNPITITEVAKKLGVTNRGKLTKMIHDLREYKMDKKTYRSKNSKPIQLDGGKLISDYASELFSLDNEEKDTLHKFLSENKISEFLFKNNRDLDQLLHKLILWIFKVDTISKMSEIIDPVYVSDFDSLLYGNYYPPDAETETALRKKRLELRATEKKKWKKRRTLKQEIADLKIAPMREKLQLELALTQFAKNNQKGFSFVDKIKKSSITTYVDIKNLYKLIYGNLKDYEKELKFRVAIYKRLIEDDSLIYDPYTRTIQKRTDFRKVQLKFP